MPQAMTVRQRLLAAIRHQPVDRVPVFIRGVPVFNEKWVESRHESYKPLIDAVREKTDPSHGVGADSGVFLTDRTAVDVSTRTEPCDKEGFVCDVVTIRTPKGDLTSRHYRSTKGLPGMRAEPYIKTPADVERLLSIPRVPPRPDLSHARKEIARVGDRALLHLGVGPNPISLLHELFESETLAFWLLDERGLLREILDEGKRRFEEFVRHCLENCEAPVFAFSGHELAIPPLMRARDFEEFVTEYERPVYKMVHDAGRLVHVHCHGKVGKFLDSFVAMGVDVVHPLEGPPMGDVTIAEARRRVGDRLAIEGNIQIGDIYSLPTEKVRELVRTAIDEARCCGGPGGYIVCPTASPYTPQLEPLVVQNYLALIDTARAHGQQ